MPSYVVSHPMQSLRIVLSIAKREIALETEQTTHDSCNMVVIHAQWTTTTIEAPADSTNTSLGQQQSIILRFSDVVPSFTGGCARSLRISAGPRSGGRTTSLWILGTPRSCGCTVSLWIPSIPRAVGCALSL
jgi:hypothetical protein